jgi:AcrR family transcriptional regulator
VDLDVARAAYRDEVGLSATGCQRHCRAGEVGVLDEHRADSALGLPAGQPRRRGAAYIDDFTEHRLGATSRVQRCSVTVARNLLERWCLGYIEAMTARTVDWGALRSPRTGAAGAEGLRERKKRLMRQQLSDMATEMFLERGFDGVRVADVAEACGVSEKTVFNYFPTKESLLLDRWDATMVSLRTGLAEEGVSPVGATVRILAEELGALKSWLEMQQDPVEARANIRRVGSMIQTTPSLRAYQSDMLDQLVGVAATILAEQAGVRSDDPEPQIAAIALLGLWQIQFMSLNKHLDDTRTPRQVQAAVARDVKRAAQLIDTGLRSFWGRVETAQARRKGSIRRTSRPRVKRARVA